MQEELKARYKKIALCELLERVEAIPKSDYKPSEEYVAQYLISVTDLRAIIAEMLKE